MLALVVVGTDFSDSLMIVVYAVEINHQLPSRGVVVEEFVCDGAEWRDVVYIHTVTNVDCKIGKCLVVLIVDGNVRACERIDVFRVIGDFLREEPVSSVCAFD